MKILFISNYRDGHNGWSEAAKLYLKAMYSAKLDVVCRPIKLNSFNGEVSEEILEMESKDLNNIDVVIQHVLPSHMMYSGKFKYNIGMCYKEAVTEKNHIWDRYLKMMDILWVPNKQMEHCDSKLGVPIETINVPCDLAEYENIKPLNIPYKESYSFYWVGDLNRRKNLKALIAAFYLGFTKSDCVSLIIKASKFGKSPREVEDEVIKLSRVVADNMGIYTSFEKYPPIMVIGDDLNRQDLLGLHKACDCFVSTAFGEGWCLPLMDALAIGNHAISSCHGGAISMQKIDNLKIVYSSSKTVMGMQNSFPGLYSSRQVWVDADPDHIAKKMQNAKQIKPDDCKDVIHQNFSIESIGQIIKERLSVLK